jgi:mono/diheme cytochrome c family protein
MKIAAKKIFKTLFFLSAISMANASFAGGNETTDPIAHGTKAHETHCIKCHGNEVYTREDRFVKSIDALSKQVARCKNNLNVPWFDEDTDAVVQFLNNKYYRF